MKGNPSKETTSRSHASEYTVEEASEICCLVIGDRPLATMVPVSIEISKVDPKTCYTAPWPHRAKEIKSISYAEGILEGLKASAGPSVAAKLQEAIEHLRKPQEPVKAQEAV